MSEKYPAKEIKSTKKLTALFEKYSVTVRKGTSTVTHKTYRIQTSCSPMQFAVFETAIKANWLTNANASTVNPKWPSMKYWSDSLGSIGVVNGFELPDPDTATTEAQMRDAAEDYYYCVKLLMKANLYYQLLD